MSVNYFYFYYNYTVMFIHYFLYRFGHFVRFKLFFLSFSRCFFIYFASLFNKINSKLTKISRDFLLILFIFWVKYKFWCIYNNQLKTLIKTIVFEKKISNLFWRSWNDLIVHFAILHNWKRKENNHWIIENSDCVID